MVACNRASLSSKLLPVSWHEVWTRFAKYGYSLTKDFRRREAVLQGGKVSSVVGACGVMGQILTFSCSAFKLMPPTIPQDRLMPSYGNSSQKFWGIPAGSNQGVCE